MKQKSKLSRIDIAALANFAVLASMVVAIIINPLLFTKFTAVIMILLNMGCWLYILYPTAESQKQGINPNLDSNWKRIWHKYETVFGFITGVLVGTAAIYGICLLIRFILGG